MLDEVFGLGAVHFVQGGQLLGLGGLKLVAAALALLHALDERRKPVSRLPVSQACVSACNSAGCKLAMTRAPSCSTAL